jgi:hypothetical protein
MAVSAGLTQDDDDKVSLTFQNAGSRRLMGSNLAVNVVIAMPNEVAARQSLSSLNIQNINAKLSSVGFPIASLVTSPHMDLPPTVPTTTAIMVTNLPANSTFPVNSTSPTPSKLQNGVGGQRPSFASRWPSTVAMILVLTALLQN